jgi:hypothetical protein
MKSLLTLTMAVAAALQSSSPQVIYDKPLDGSIGLRIIVSHANKDEQTCCTTHVQVQLTDRTQPQHTWDIATIDDEYEFTYAVERATRDSVVLLKTDSSYGFQQGCVKLFVDTAAKRLLKRVDYALDKQLQFASDTDAERTLGVSTASLIALKAGGLVAGSVAVPLAMSDDEPMRQRVAQHAPPSSAYRQFARSRPDKVRPPYDDPTYWSIEENVGAVQAERDVIWFGRTFYDGEGQTGVGDIGYLDGRNRIAMLDIRAAADWSIDTMLVERNTIWAGLTGHPEGADYGGGLLEYNRRTKRSTIHRMSGVVKRIVRTGEGLFVGTSHGVYVLRQARLTRFRAEPSLDDGVIVVVDRI